MGYMTTPSAPAPVVTHPDLTRQYEGIGGWLILVAIGLVLTPLRILLFLGRDFLPIFTTGSWGVLTTPGTEAYHHLWAPLIIFEGLGNLAFAIGSGILISLFFSKRRIFPRWIIVFYVANLIFVVGDAAVGNLIPQLAAMEDSDTAKEIARSAVACLIWVPYFLVSKRVKATFVA